MESYLSSSRAGEYTYSEVLINILCKDDSTHYSSIDICSYNLRSISSSATAVIQVRKALTFEYLDILFPCRFN